MVLHLGLVSEYDQLGIRALALNVLGSLKVALSRVSFIIVECVAPMRGRLLGVLRKTSLISLTACVIEYKLYLISF